MWWYIAGALWIVGWYFQVRVNVYQHIHEKTAISLGKWFSITIIAIPFWPIGASMDIGMRKEPFVRKAYFLGPVRNSNHLWLRSLFGKVFLIKE